MSTKMTIIEGLKSSDASSRLQVLFDLEMDQVDHDVIKLMIRLIEEDPAQSVRLEALRRVEELWPNTTVRGFYRQILMDGMLQNAGPVAASLGRIGDDSARVLLLEVYSKASQFAIRWLCFDCLLGSWPYGAVQDLVTGYFILDADEVIRASAVAYLGRQHDPSVVPELTRLLDDPCARVRSNAVEALTPMANLVKRETFERMTKDPDHRVQSCAAVALVKCGPYCMDSWFESVIKSSFDLTRASAAWALRQVPEVPNRSRYLDALLADSSSNVQRQAIITHKSVH